MLNFHFCTSYSNRITETADKTIRKKIDDLSRRDSLVGVSAIIKYGDLHILRTNQPQATQTFIQEKNVTIDGVEVKVFFVQYAVNHSDALFAQYKIIARNGEWSDYHPIKQTDIDTFIESYQSKLPLPANDEPQSPPPALTHWHQEYKLNVAYDVYESENWAAFAMSNADSDGMKTTDIALYRLALLQATQKNTFEQTGEEIHKTDLYSIRKLELNNVVIIYTIFYFNQINTPYFLLHSGAHKITQPELLNSIDQNLPLDTLNKIDNLESINRYALKAYPKWVLTNEVLWQSIQKNSTKGNLSLLPEQTTFLKNAKFPIYIQGQAGSGKSTMLYYLFANIYYLKCADLITGDIIFLTENEDLLTQTIEAIRELLLCNPEFELSQEDIFKVDRHFYTFKRFLFNLLQTEDVQTEQFKQDKYLSFSKFKILYEHSPLPEYVKNRFPAEVAWYAISTFFYGYDLDAVTDSEYYEKQVPRNIKVLPPDVIREIERVVLPFYKRLLENGYWDKIKLIRHLRKNNYTANQFEVVFCDEAQDFSRVELQFILSLSKYMQYNLSQINMVPIVFAGDALQTVRPTGFRPDEVKDMFYAELLSRQFNTPINNHIYTPIYNYRSSQAIVNIANAIQYYRKKHIPYVTVESPQIAKFPTHQKDSFLNPLLHFNTLTNIPKLLNKLKHKVFIVPINTDEKPDYIRNNTILSNFEDDIRTSVETKGIDYKEIVLFGFGNYYLQKFETLEASKEERTYEVGFFFNKLYVAITRACYELIIVDNIEAEEQFWKPLLQNYAKSDWAKLSDTTETEIMESIIYDIKDINIDNIRETAISEAIKLAKKEREQAKINGDVNWLRLIANKFLKLGNSREYYLTIALRFELEEKWKDAAEYYLKKEVGNKGLDNAALMYWQGKHWQLLLNLQPILQGHQNIVLTTVAYLFANGYLIPDQVILLKNLRSDFSQILLSTTWRNDIITKLLEFSDTLTNQELVLELLNILEYITPIEYRSAIEKIAALYYKINRYEQALEKWDSVGFDQMPYPYAASLLAKQNGKFNDEIYWLGECIKVEGIVAEKNKFAGKVIDIYNRYSFEINNRSPYSVKSSIFLALMYQPIETNLLNNFISAFEQSFQEKEKYLIEFYEYIIKNNSSTNLLRTFVLNRWAKNSAKLNIPIAEINTRLNNLPNLTQQQQQAFTQREIDQLPNFPTNLSAEPENHVRNITVKNFKKFSNVHIANIGLFNIVVGNNNTGKTSVLEALLFNPDPVVYLKSLAYAYIERRKLLPVSVQSLSNGQDIIAYRLNSDFLQHFKNANNNSDYIEFELLNNRNTWQYRVNISPNPVSWPKDEIPVINLLSMPDLNYIENIQHSDFIHQPYIPYGKGFGNELAQVYFHEISPKHKLDDAFIKSMGLFIPDITRILPDTLTGNINIRDRAYEDDQPLHQYGEGANKLFRILITLALHKGKRVMIDEIDAGIHYSKFKEFWKIILQAAMNDNTQLIVTTHNDECISYFNEILADMGDIYQKEARIIQCKEINTPDKEKNLKIRTYEYEDFNAAYLSNIETRG